MNPNQVLVFKSIDAWKQNPQNKPGHFTTKFTPELILEENSNHFFALDHLSMTASWFNVRPEYGNNQVVISKDSGNSWQRITFPAGVYDYEDINNYIHNVIGKTADGNYGINIFFDLSTFKVFISLNATYQIDFSVSGTFCNLLGFDPMKLTGSAYGAREPNISNSVDNLYIRCSLLSNSIISGKRSDVLFSFSTNTKTRALPFELTQTNYLWQRINTKHISEVTFWITDDEDREVDLNGQNISLTVVIKKVD